LLVGYFLSWPGFGSELVPDRIVDQRVRDVYAKTGRRLAQYLGVQQVRQQLERYPAEIHLSALVTIDSLQHADPLNQVAHGEAYTPDFAGHDAWRVDELLIHARQHHADDHQYQYRSHRNRDTLPAGF
jgi:hypothetical protein